MNEVVPDEVVAGPVPSDAGYSVVFGGSAAVAFAFDLTEISDSESPVWSMWKFWAGSQMSSPSNPLL